MLPNLYDDEDDIKEKNKEKNNQKKEELNVIKEKEGKPSKINQKKGIISKKKEPIFQILPSKMVSEKEKSKNDKFCDSFF